MNMKASQYIYTSWKNAPNHGFSLYSMTPGISQIDCNDISKMMKYIQQPGMPRDPSDEEIANVLPRNVSFFRLSSGKYCLAQSTYVGREYRGFEDGGRTGNYLLHAYVIDDIEDMIPMSFVGDNIFRWDLTKEEWTTTSPNPLPVVDLPPIGRMLSSGEINSFFTSERINTLTKLVQGVINSAKAGKKVFFNDDSKNMPYWYKALSVCLPANLARSVTFNTFSLSAEMPMGISAECALTIVNVSASMSPSVPITPPSVTDEARKGNIIIDLVRNINTEVEVQSFARMVVEKFKVNIYDAISFAKKAGSLAEIYNCSLESAIDITKFLDGNLSDLGSFEQIRGIVSLIGDKADERTRAAIVNFSSHIVNGEYGFSENILAFIKNNIYPIASAEVRNRLIDYVLKQAVNTASRSEVKAYIAEVNRMMPCSIYATADCVFSSGYYRVLASGDEFNVMFLASLIAENYNSLSTRYPDITNVLQEILNRYVSIGNTRDIDALCDFSPENVIPCLLTSFKSYIDRHALAGMRMDVFFYMVRKTCKSKLDAVRALSAGIATWSNDRIFVQKYRELVSNDSSLDAELRRNPANNAFFMEMEASLFASAAVTIDTLYRYFNQVYLKKEDDTVFILKLKEYLSEKTTIDAVIASLDIFENCFKTRQFMTTNDKNALVVLYKNVVSNNDTAKLLDLFNKDKNILNRVREFVKFVNNEGIKVDVKYFVVEAYLKDISQPSEKIYEMAKNGELLKDITSNREMLEIFNNELFGSYLCVIYDAFPVKNVDGVSLASSIVNFAKDDKSFKNALVNMYTTRDSRVRGKADVFAASLLLYICVASNKVDSLVCVYKDFMKSLANKNRGDIISMLKRMTHDKEILNGAMYLVGETNSREKLGFFAKIFGGGEKNKSTESSAMRRRGERTQIGSKITEDGRADKNFPKFRNDSSGRDEFGEKEDSRTVRGLRTKENYRHSMSYNGIGRRHEPKEIGEKFDLKTSTRESQRRNVRFSGENEDNDDKR